ncbi:hypothetical protein [Streptomyces sp. NPDC046161]|uniref:hypothetical protein n=1 Tax=Streptomyces sp. NPDC046161 TaxID=3155132 RepID=UPI0034023953
MVAVPLLLGGFAGHGPPAGLVWALFLTSRWPWLYERWAGGEAAAKRRDAT